MSVRKLLVASAAVVGAVIVIGAAAGSSSAPPDGTTPAVAPATTTSSSTSARAGAIEDGTFLVGEDIAPGTYRATVPADSFGCYWARLKGASGVLQDIIANGTLVPGGRAVVTIKATDQAFQSAGCGAWTKGR